MRKIYERQLLNIGVADMTAPTDRNILWALLGRYKKQQPSLFTNSAKTERESFHGVRWTPRHHSRVNSPWPEHCSVYGHNGDVKPAISLIFLNAIAFKRSKD
ncbi:hypothetical protein T4B_9420 [Trichinella pseudospiralis]|uniref:Uncharacterized protein n=1 Tax=Trichinella pseudospiralis TaxID=6337 RepID=A0A0V1IBK3_TRIPS|nr:hypothetical protein T4B_9420 [Trichinella pseudospiralis]